MVFFAPARPHGREGRITNKGRDRAHPIPLRRSSSDNGRPPPDVTRDKDCDEDDQENPEIDPEDRGGGLPFGRFLTDSLSNDQNELVRLREVIRRNVGKAHEPLPPGGGEDDSRPCLGPSAGGSL